MHIQVPAYVRIQALAVLSSHTDIHGCAPVGAQDKCG